VRWRCVDLQQQSAGRYGVNVHERTVGKILRRLDMARLQPRPCHPQKDPAAEAAFRNLWPAPSASSFHDSIHPVCINVSGL
jgi:transposase